MFGNFQESHLRIEVNAKADTIADSLLNTAQLRQWLIPQILLPGGPDKLESGLKFTTWTGPIPVEHRVSEISDRHICLLLSQGIDGYHEWSWGDGWLQSRLEGISLLPLNLGHTLSLLRLRLYLATKTPKTS